MFAFTMKSVLVVFILSFVLTELCCFLEEEWSEFKLNYNKTYKSKSDESRKFRAFKKNLQEISRHNKRFQKGLETFEKGITKYADLSKVQFDKKYGLLRMGELIKYEDVMKNKSISTEYFDWRDRGAVSPVKEQGVCGSCWIFSAVGMLEGYNFRKTGQLIPLSEQNIVDCFSNTTCKGGFPGDAIMYIKRHGISKYTDYPYKGKQKKCRNNLPKIKTNFESYDFLNNTEENLKYSLNKYGPLGVSLYVSGNWRLYKRGVWYEKKCSELTNHAVVLVGYGTENGEDYWLIKNSWGRLWGEDGYIKIARNKHENYCGLTNEAMYII